MFRGTLSVDSGVAMAQALIELKVIVEMEFFGQAERIAQVSNITLGRAVFDAACQIYPKVEIVMREGARVIDKRPSPPR